jgi:nucleoside-diphosphate-sugar epimerase
MSRLQPTHLLHLAWCAKPGSFWTSPDNLEWLDCSIRLFQQFAHCGGRRLVATGSCAEYDWTAGVCHEATTPCRPRTLYGRTKLAAATYLDAMNGRALSTSWARLFFLYGPGASEQRMPGVVISALNRNEFANCSEGTQRRDFLHIDDAGRAIVSLLDSDVTGPMNLCSGQATSIREMAIQTAELLGKRELLRLGTVPTASNEPPLIVGDNSRLRDELGWIARYSLPEGLRQTIACWPQHRS